MKTRTILRGERGVILPTTLIIVAVLMSLAIALLALSGHEPWISKNLESGAQARAVAEAGIQWTLAQLAASPNWSTTLASAGASGVTLASDQIMPGSSASFGTFTVIVRNDSQANDNQITGVPVDAGGATNDTNAILIVTSTGTVGNASRTIRTVVRRAVLPPIPAAMNFPGNEADTYFSGTAFEVNGNDFNMNDTAGTCAPVWGIATATTAYETRVQTSLGSTEKALVMGRKQVVSGAANGDNVIAADTTLTQAGVASFVAAAAKGADLSFQSHMPPSGTIGMTATNVGNTCASNWNDSNCWGTAARPKIVYIKGDPDPTSAFTGLQLTTTGGATNTGYGILIIEDGDLRIDGKLNWNGLIIVTGQWVGMGFLDTGTVDGQKIHGAMIVNETRSDSGYEGVVTGNAVVRYSCEGIALAQSSRRLVSVTSWKEL